MRADIIILSKTQELVAKALASIASHVDKRSIGQVIVGWTGEDQYETAETDIKGIPVLLESLLHYNFAENNNYLVDKHCTSEAVLFMNDDVELVEDSVTRCLKDLEADTKVGTVGIKLLYPNRTIQHAGQFIAVKNYKFARCGHLCLGKPDFKISDKPLVVIGNTGAFLMMRRQDFIDAGMFNEAYVHCFEDVELNIAVTWKLHKFNICDVTTWAWHAESQTRKQALCMEDMQRIMQYFNDFNSPERRENT